MGAENDIVESFRTDMTCAVRLRRPLLECEVTEWADKLAAEIGRLRGEVGTIPQWIYGWMADRGIVPADDGDGIDASELLEALNQYERDILAEPAPAMPNGVEAARVLADFAETAPGRLPGRVQDAIATIRAADSRDAAGVVTDDRLTLTDVSGALTELAEKYEPGERAPLTDEERAVLVDFVTGVVDEPLFKAVAGHYFAQNPRPGARPPAAEVREVDAVLAERVLDEWQRAMGGTVANKHWSRSHTASMVTALTAALSPPGRAEGE